jgi:hypothetical protein
VVVENEENLFVGLHLGEALELLGVAFELDESL